jgi:hypothetical protein
MIEIDFFAKMSHGESVVNKQKALNLKRKVGKYKKSSTLKNNTKKVT